MRSSSGRDHLRRLVARLGLLAAAFLLILILFEVLLRFTSFPLFGPDALTAVHARRIQRNAPYSYVVSDEKTGWKLYPDLSANVRLPTGLSAASGFPGYRSPRTYALEPEARARRVVVVGDSHSFGWRLPVTDAYPHLLESLCGETEVINLGVPGYGVDQGLLMLREYGLQLSPDLVVLGFYPDDMLRNLDVFRAHERFPKPRFTLTEGSDDLAYSPPPVGRDFLVDGSYLLGEQGEVGALSVALWKNSRLFRLIKVEGGKLAHYAGFGGAWRLNEAILDEFAVLAEQGGFKLVVLFIPAQRRMNGPVGRLVYSRLETLMRDWAQQRDVELVDLTPTFEDLYQEEPALYLPDGHLGKTGHDLAAMQLVERTCEAR